MKYIFIIYLFHVIDANTFLLIETYKFNYGEVKKGKYLIFSLITAPSIGIYFYIK